MEPLTVFNPGAVKPLDEESQEFYCSLCDRVISAIGHAILSALGAILSVATGAWNSTCRVLTAISFYLGLGDLVLADGRRLLVHPTLGDGSCGLHALMGELVDGKYRCDISKVREEFVNWLLNKYERKELPKQIKNVLEEHFRRFDVAPYEFRELVKEAHAKYYAGFDAKAEGVYILTLKEQEQRIEAFINDSFIFTSYLAYLGQVSTHLLQDELMVAGECFGKKILLCQPAWNGAWEVDCNDPDAVVDENTVCIWYNGSDHYERAEIITEPKEEVVADIEASDEPIDLLS